MAPAPREANNALMPKVADCCAVNPPSRSGNTRSPSTGRITQLAPINPIPAFTHMVAASSGIALHVSHAFPRLTKSRSSQHLAAGGGTSVACGSEKRIRLSSRAEATNDNEFSTNTVLRPKATPAIPPSAAPTAKLTLQVAPAIALAMAGLVASKLCWGSPGAAPRLEQSPAYGLHRQQHEEKPQMFTRAD